MGSVSKACAEASVWELGLKWRKGKINLQPRRVVEQALRDDLSLYIGGETIFREKCLPGRADGEPVPRGAFDRTALIAQRAAPVCFGV